MNQEMRNQDASRDAHSQLLKGSTHAEGNQFRNIRPRASIIAHVNKANDLCEREPNKISNKKRKAKDTHLEKGHSE